MANATGLCILCNVEVTEEDHRREVDCPSKTCPGRVYHEDCIAQYLKRTKYSKDRCTGFPCPAMLSTGKQCPGYVCKMHTFFPANQKKKQARLQAAIAAAAVAAAPKPRPAPAKAKAGAQVAIAAMKLSGHDGSTPVIQRFPKPKDPHGTMQTHGGINGTSSVIQPRVVPGLEEAVLGGHRPGGLKSQTAVNNVNAGQAKVGVGNGKRSKLDEADDDTEEWPSRSATVWDAISRAAGMGGELNYYDLERNNGDGHFTSRLKKRLEGNKTPAKAPDVSGYDGTSLESDSWQTMPSKRRVGENIWRSGVSSGDPSVLSGDDFCALQASALVSLNPKHEHSAPSETFLHANDHDDFQRQIAAAAAGMDAGLMGVQEDKDRVHEYDMVFATDDGSYMVFDTFSNTYVMVEDLYGPAPGMQECLAEDGNMYLCVMVRDVQKAKRAEWQEAWVQSQIDDLQYKPQHPTVPVTNLVGLEQAAGQVEAGMDVLTPTVVNQSYVNPYDTMMGAPTSGLAEVAPVEDEDDTDVASLMQLLCV